VNKAVSIICEKIWIAIFKFIFKMVLNVYIHGLNICYLLIDRNDCSTFTCFQKFGIILTCEKNGLVKMG